MAKAPRGHACAIASHKCLPYAIATKLQAVELAEILSKEAAARQFKVDPKRICERCPITGIQIDL